MKQSLNAKPFKPTPYTLNPDPLHLSLRLAPVALTLGSGGVSRRGLDSGTALGVTCFEIAGFRVMVLARRVWDLRL